MPSREPRADTRGEIIGPSERDQRAAAALVTAGALVAIADKQADTTERKEFMRYINDRQLVPTIAEPDVAKLFDERVRRLEQPDFANVAIEALRPVSELSLAPDIIELAERVAAADRYMHSHEWQAIRLIRLITMSLPQPKVMISSPGSPRTTPAPREVDEDRTCREPNAVLRRRSRVFVQTCSLTSSTDHNKE
ncbi:TerB family tellurite resistance protein [Bradyrhizobium retamae]|uniref:TerB family tellurite resistance protein n=1 Tax=Bradyrhizobium retamae TaxID=1300035 RepID=UPI0009EC49C4|nr:TerB family tellurite resistance protein [Bradyrhizobium retamae]